MINMTAILRDHRLHILLVFALLACLYFAPAFMNSLPKGSDTYYHMRIGKSILESGNLVLFDPLNAGGTPNAYPPLLHLILAGLYSVLDPFLVSMYLGPILSLLSAGALYLLAGSLFGKKPALLAAFIYGVSLEIINTAIYTGPANLGLLLIPLSLYLAGKWLDTGKHVFLALGITASVCLALTHTISFLVFLLFFLALFTRNLKRAWPFLISLPVFACWIYFTQGLASSVIFTEPVSVFSYFLMFPAVFLIFLVPGLFRARKPLVLLFLVLFAWSLAVPLYPARIATYSIIPASMITAAGFLWLYRRYTRNLLRAGLLILLVLSLGFFLQDTGFTRAEMAAQDLSALDWIRGNTPQGSVVAATWQVSGVWIPAVAERTNVLGALQEAVPDFEERREALGVIFGSDDRALVEEAINKYSVDYIYINSREEQILFQGAAGRLGSMFSEVYSDGYVHVYQV